MTSQNAAIEKINFTVDGLLLYGKLHLPAIERPPLIIGCHGLFSTQESPKQIALAAACNASGMAYFRFDHRGCGISQGNFEQITTLGARCRDLESAISVMRHRGDTGCIGLFGSSMGGSVCLSVAAVRKVAGIVTFAAPLRSNSSLRGPAQTTDAGPSGIFLDAQQIDFDISGKIPDIDHLLVIHGESDKTVPVAHAQEIYGLAGVPKKLIIQPGGDHRMSNAEHQRVFIREATDWLKSALTECRA